MASLKQQQPMEQLLLKIGVRLVIQGEHWYFHAPVERVFISSKIIWILLVNFTQSTVLHMVASVRQPTCFLIETSYKKLSRFYPSKIYHTVGEDATFREGWGRYSIQCTAILKKKKVGYDLAFFSVIHCSKISRECMSISV